MKFVRTAAVLASLLAAGTAFAQSTSQPKASAKSAPAPKAATTHATQGVVKSIDSNSLVITKTAGKGPETSFVLNASTQREGTIAAGVPVDVRYRDEGKTKVATAITMHQPKQPAAAKSKSAK